MLKGRERQWQAVDIQRALSFGNSFSRKDKLSIFDESSRGSFKGSSRGSSRPAVASTIEGIDLISASVKGPVS